jgi:PAS domain S-box-containing protein
MPVTTRHDTRIRLRQFIKPGENNQHLLERIADCFPALIFIFDPETNKIDFLNHQFERYLHYNDSDIEGFDGDLFELVYPEDRAHIEEQLRLIREDADEHTRSFRARFKEKSGDVLDFQIIVLPFSNEDQVSGRYVLFICEDVTTQLHKEAELEALKELENETERLLHFGTWQWDLSTDRMTWSNGMYSLLDYHTEEQPYDITSTIFYSHVPHHELEKVTAAFQFSINTKSHFEFTHSLRTLNNQVKIVFTKGRIVCDDEQRVIKLTGVTRDVTQQSLAHKDLADYKQMMLDKEKFLNSGSWEYDFEDGSLIWSEGNFRLFGFDPETEELPARVSSDLFRQFLDDDDRLSSRNIWTEFVGNKDEQTWEFNIITRQGTRKRLESYARMIRDNSGNPVKVIGTCRDITQVRNYEQSLKEKINELDRSNKELEEFAYIASHDLQEPLRKITAFSERLKEKSGDSLGSDGQLYLDRMLAATVNMRTLIDNLLEFSRTSRFNQPFTKTDLSDVVSAVQAELELTIEETKSVIRVNSMPSIDGIPSQMQQLFGNLINNAIKFRKPGEPAHITISSQPLTKLEKQEKRLRTDRTYFRVVVSDAGIGFEQQFENKIFQIFQRLHGKAEYPGSGIGLAICKKIVENHKGLITAIGRPDEGAEFVIILPEVQ